MVSASDASLVRFSEIQSRLSAAEKIDDLRVLKTHLCDCPAGMATEVEEHRRNSASSMAKLAEGAQEFESSVDHTHKRAVCDPVTGLPARAEAEAALSKVAGSGVAALAVVFAVKRLKQMNARFGYEVGNRVLAELSAYVGSGANPEEGLYRWSGPALLAVISRNAPFDRIRQEIGRLVARMPQHEIAIGARTVIISVSIGWAVFPVTRPVDRLIRQLETFVESQSSEDSYATR